MYSRFDADSTSWVHSIIDACPELGDGAAALAVGDLDGDGNLEIVCGGTAGICWYRPNTGEKRRITDAGAHVGMILEDIDGDGFLEVFCGSNPHGEIGWYKSLDPDLRKWEYHVLDDASTGGAHDLVFYDLDGDGTRELIVNAVYCAVPGLFIYKPGSDLHASWHKYKVQEGTFEEGLDVGDLDGQGGTGIVSGTNCYLMPENGSLSGPWERVPVSRSLREMVRVALIDVTGNGRLDVVMAESEYVDGRIAWYENTIGEDGHRLWVEHPMDQELCYAHSMTATHAPDGTAEVYLAEMMEGGWNAPRNFDAKLIRYRYQQGEWQRGFVSRGFGTHQGMAIDVDGDGKLEFVGKECFDPKVHIWQQRPNSMPEFEHVFIDRDKPSTGTDIFVAALSGEEAHDVVCGKWWYQYPNWQRHELPEGCQALTCYDVDSDGQCELIAIRTKKNADSWYEELCSDLVWLKPVDALVGNWDIHSIGVGCGDWPHAATVAPVLPNGQLALLVGYHSAGNGRDFPELFEIPGSPEEPWPKRTLAEIAYGEEIVVTDITGDGSLDVVLGCHWLENLGDGNFRSHRLVAEDVGFKPARVRVADMTGNSRPDVVISEEDLDFKNKHTPFSRLAWFECPDDPTDFPWQMHVIDKVRCAHSLDVADLDGDGIPEVICGEHNPWPPYRSRSRLLVYRQNQEMPGSWSCNVLDDRFEHHDGTKVVQFADGRRGIISHGWWEPKYVHLWLEREKHPCQSR